MPIFDCTVCRTALSASETQAGQWVRCPKCKSTMRVPSAAAGVESVASSPAGAGASGSTGSAAAGGSGDSIGVAPPPITARSGTAAIVRGAGTRRYGFNCVYCSSRLEATESMAATEGTCPTCGKTIVIPIMDRYGRLIDPNTQQVIKQDPHPVHAYAAAGERAPKILRRPDGSQWIQCTRCPAQSPITANNCTKCGMPFTMEGTTAEAAGANNGFCVTALVLGIISIPAFCTVIVPVLAIVFGIIGYSQVAKAGVEGGGKGMAIAGMICGAVGLAILVLLRVF